MSLPAASQPIGTASPSRPEGSGVATALERVQEKLDAALAAVHLDGASRCLVRDLPGARVLEDLWRHGAEGLKAQIQSAADGVIGTNRLRGERDGPVCGRLIAVALHNGAGAVVGILAAARTIDQPKLGPEDTRRLRSIAAQLEAVLSSPARCAGLLGWSAFKEHALLAESAGGGSGCILYGDVDQMHVLNKLAGLTAGDEAIAEIGAALIEQPLPQGAEVCHISGDRFAVYAPRSSLSQGRRMGEQLCRAVSERCAVLSGLRTRLSISFGVAAVPPNDPELTQTLAAAEAACRAAKDRGRSRVEVYQDTDASIIQRNHDVLIAERLHRTLESQRFAVVAQPLVRLDGAGGTEYFELLTRLLSDTGTYLSPALFIPAAVRYQMLIELDRAILARVFKALRAAHKGDPGRDVRYSINLSGPSIGNADFLEWLSASIGPDAVPGKWLQLEITETAAVANVSQTQTLIRHLRSRGVEFALDDFGTGVSSLAYLKAFDVAMLKLDGSFIRDLLTDTRSESLVRGVVQLARSMGIQTVAECIETEAVRQRLQSLGIDRGQGFVFGQPLPLEDVCDRSARAAPARD